MLAEMARGKGRVFPVYVRAGLVWEEAELKTLRRFLAALPAARVEPLAVLELPMADLAANHWSVTGRGLPGYRCADASYYIPGRNLCLLAKTAMFCARNRIDTVAMALLEANPFPDARPEFLAAFARAVELGLGLNLRIVTPYRGLDKAEVIRRGRSLPLELTLSCGRPDGGGHCGACNKCAERIKAFKAAGVTDPTRYALQTSSRNAVR